MDVEPLLKLMLEKQGSDLFVTEGKPPCIKVNGLIKPVGKQELNHAQTRAMVLNTMDEAQQEEFLRVKELNYAITTSERGPNKGRFRVNAFFQRNACGMVLRRIETVIPTPESLNLPPILKELAMNKRGIIIFVGGTGTGKSTSLASLIGHRNESGNGHIVTIEDPIEFVHEHKGCIITQRELGVDTESWGAALKSTLRQAPDVILIGEIRESETMEHAIAFAETGHLVFATLHANNANQALDRIINFFPHEKRDQLLMDLSLNMRAFIAQQLIPTIDGKGRRAAIEILINSPLITDLVRKGDIHEIKEIMKKSREIGMQTFDQALYELYNEGLITQEDALKHADSANDLRLMIKLQSGGEMDFDGDDEDEDTVLFLREDDKKSTFF